MEKDAKNPKYALKQAELIYKISPCAIFTVDRDKRITSWNDKAAAITGYSFEEIKGKVCTIFSDLPCGTECGLYSDGLLKPIVGRECVIRRKDGQKRTILQNADYLKDLNGNIIGGIESFEDITELKRLTGVKDEFISSMSHELRTPLSIIKEGLSLVLDGIPGPINKKQEELLVMVKNNIDRLTKVINKILEMSNKKS